MFKSNNTNLTDEKHYGHKNQRRHILALSIPMSNFKTQYQNNLDCRLCKKFTESQDHLFECLELKKAIPELKSNSSVEYKHIFGDITQIRASVKLLTSICEERECQIEILNDLLCKQQPSY